MALSSLAVTKAKPRDKQYKLADGHGLYLLVTPQGGRYWRMNYRFDGKAKTMAMRAPRRDGRPDSRVRPCRPPLEPGSACAATSCGHRAGRDGVGLRRLNSGVGVASL